MLKHFAEQIGARRQRAILCAERALDQICAVEQFAAGDDVGVDHSHHLVDQLAARRAWSRWLGQRALQQRLARRRTGVGEDAPHRCALFCRLRLLRVDGWRQRGPRQQRKQHAGGNTQAAQRSHTRGESGRLESHDVVIHIDPARTA
jgi:hypothetical protein